MRRLTITQINHLTTRIDEALNKLIVKEKLAIGKCPDFPGYSESDKIRMIRSGRAVLPKNFPDHYNHLTNFFNYPENAAQRAAKIRIAAWSKKSTAIQEKYAAEKKRLVDMIVLGDSDEAMNVLRALELRVEGKNRGGK